VPWAELARYEIVRDEAAAFSDYFLLWDRAGRCRVDARPWMGDVSAADRARIFRVLRYRFPGKGELEGETPAPAGRASAGAASSSVWDRELDG
jgi:hypothetical protein